MKFIRNIINYLFNYRYYHYYNGLFKGSSENYFFNDKLSALLSYAVNNIEYYKEFNQNKPIEISNFPFLTKDIIKSNSQILLNHNVNNSRKSHNSTSGSTGEALNFYSDKKLMFIRHATADFGDGFSGWNLGEPRLIIWGAERDIKYSIKRNLAYSKYLFNTKIVSSYNMRDDDVINYIDLINKFRPTLIIGYPSTLAFLAESILKNKFKIPYPKGIISSGESLIDYQREIIVSAFQSKVFNRYGCREVGIIASECDKHNGLHIHTNHILVEVIDENGRPCEPGELGEIVVTDLDNYVFPFIRYKIGDLGVMSNEKCSCGRNSPLLKDVVGRSFELIIGTNGNRVPGNFFTLLRHKIQGVDQFKIEQFQYGKVSIKLKVNKLWNNTEQNLLLRLLKEKLGDDMIIELSIVDEFKNTKTGKFNWINSKLSPFQ